jgi:hypothetical protein
MPGDARKEAEEAIYEFVQDIDPSGFNAASYKALFAKMSDTEFGKLMKAIAEEPDYNLFVELSMADGKTLPDMDKIEALSKKYKIPLAEYVAFPHKADEEGGRVPVTATPAAILYIQVMRLQQLLDKKSAASARIDKVNAITGQVVGADKSASISDTQTMSLATTGQYDSLRELLGPRADDKVAKAKMLDMIEKTGDFDINDLETNTAGKQSVQTTKMYLMAAGLDVQVGNTAKKGAGGTKTPAA